LNNSGWSQGDRSLADLPSLDVLRAKTGRVINAPATKLVQIIQTPGTQLARVIKAKARKAKEFPACTSHKRGSTRNQNSKSSVHRPELKHPGRG